MDSAAPLLSAVQIHLKAQPELQALVDQRVYGAVPAKPTYPYVLITCTSQPFSADDFAGMQHTLRVQGFARENKPATVLAIRKAVYSALNRQESLIGTDDGDVILIEHDGVADAFPEEDGRTYQSIIEFNVLVA